MDEKRLARLGALGGSGVVVVLLLLYAVFVFAARPVGEGIDVTEAFVALVSVGLVFLTIIAAHLVYVGVLLRVARGDRFTV